MQLNGKKKLIIILTVAAVWAGAYGLGKINRGEKLSQVDNKSASAEYKQSNYDTKLKIDPESFTHTRNDEFNVDVVIEPGGNKVTAVVLNMKFDAEKLKLNEISYEEDLFPTVLQKGIIDNKNGNTSLVLGVGVGSEMKPIEERVKIATLSFEALEDVTESSVRFTKKSLISALAQEGNVLDNRTFE